MTLAQTIGSHLSAGLQNFLTPLGGVGLFQMIHIGTWCQLTLAWKSTASNPNESHAKIIQNVVIKSKWTSKPKNWKLWKNGFVSYEFSIFWNTLLISLVFYWRASKKFIVLSWKKFIGWPIPNHCSAVEASIFYRGIKSYLYFLQFNLFQSIWIEQKILRYLQLLIVHNSKFQNFPGFST